jgi:predicted flavoprotein YhiN
MALTCDGGPAGEAVVTRDGLEGGVVYAAFAGIHERLDVWRGADHRRRRPTARRVAGSSARLGQAIDRNFLRKVAGMAPIAIGLAREGAGGPLPGDPRALATLIKAIPLTVVGAADLARAISTAGGVSFDAVDDNLMLRARPGVFVAGEMLDWEAPTGGYLLQATFATAIRAAEGALRWLGQPDPAAVEQHGS